MDHEDPRDEDGDELANKRKGGLFHEGPVSAATSYQFINTGSRLRRHKMADGLEVLAIANYCCMAMWAQSIINCSSWKIVKVDKEVENYFFVFRRIDVRTVSLSKLVFLHHPMTSLDILPADM